MKRLNMAVLGLFLLSPTFNFAQAKAYADGKPTSKVVPNANQYKFDFPITAAAASKAFSSPINIEGKLSYTIYVGGGEAQYGLDNIHYESKKVEGQKSWKKYAKTNPTISVEVDGKDVNDVFRILKSGGVAQQRP